MNTPSTDPARWFAEQVQPHEPELRAYLRRQFPTVRDVDDVVQESYVRIMQLPEPSRIASIRAYLFVTARNLALGLLRRPKIFSDEPLSDVTGTEFADDRRDVAEAVSRNQEVALLLDAIEALPARCREIFVLRKLQGCSQKEIAARLRLSEQTVQVQIARGARKCADYLRLRGVTGH